MPNYYDDETNARDYIKMAEGYDGRELIEALQGYLPEGATLLELGMGPGKDLELLSQSYQVTGSDNSQTFLDIYRQKNPDADLLLLDAITIGTDRKFDGIYSNKVLHHLSADELKDSFLKQREILNPGGILFHSFWYGDREEFMHGLRFRYYTGDLLLPMVQPHFEVLETNRYHEFEEGDSFYLVLKKG
jgi:SAM-dependent methyltransferase